MCTEKVKHVTDYFKFGAGDYKKKQRTTPNARKPNSGLWTRDSTSTGYRIAGNFRMPVQIFFFFECTFRMRKFEHAKNYNTRAVRTRASDHTKF